MRYVLIIFLLMSCQKEISTAEKQNEYGVMLQFDKYCGLSQLQIDSIIKRVKQNFSPFPIDFTTDEMMYAGYEYGKKQRVFITDSIFGQSHIFVIDRWYIYGGTAIPGSFLMDPEYPAKVYTFNFNFRVADIAGAICHELGHTLGLAHQFNSEPAIMGKQFAHSNAYWVSGINESGKQQNDIEFIKLSLK